MSEEPEVTVIVHTQLLGDVATAAMQAQLAKYGPYLFSARIGENTVVMLQPRLADQWAIVRGRDDDDGYDDEWMYRGIEDAMRGYLVWVSCGFVGEPTRWTRYVGRLGVRRHGEESS